jgi:hypothetical protein
MQPDPRNLTEIIDLQLPLIGFYDAPDESPFYPLVEPNSDKRCVFAFFNDWLNGETLHITKDHYGCGGAGHWLCGITTRSRQGYIEFLVDNEGLKASHDLMDQWLDQHESYQQEHGNILIGPLREGQYEFLKTVTFYVNPDQICALMLGAQYNSAPEDPPPVIAPFGSGCMEMVTLFDNLAIPQAIIGATDIAMRKHLPPNLLAFTVTKSMFEQLCELDESSFLYKPFWSDLRKAREREDA